MLAATIALVAASAVSGVPAPVRAAVASAVVPSAARAEALNVEGSLRAGCALQRVEVPRPVTASGRVAVHLLGTTHDCEAWAWVDVRVTAAMLVTTRLVRAGAPLAGATTPRDAEVLPGRPLLDTLPEGAVAERDLPAGTPVVRAAIRVGPRPGDPVSVVLRVGDLTVEQSAHAVACQRDRACALLPSGHRVEGRWHAGRIELDTQ